MKLCQTRPFRPAPHVRGRRVALLIGLTAASFGLCSCVASEKPLVSETKPVVGQQFTAELFRSFSEGEAHEVRKATFQWQDGAYLNDGTGATDVARFVVQPLQGDDSIIQSTDVGGKIFRYWIGRKLTDGAYLIVPVDEANVDAAARDAACAKGQPAGICIVRTRDQLLALAYATADRPVKNAEIAIVVKKGLEARVDTPAVR